MITSLIVLALAAAPPVSYETEARRLEAALIAPCCWMQQVSVHSSPAADKIRTDIRARLAAGQTRQQVLDAYVAEYGQAILAEPPARGSNLALYIAPPVVLGTSAALLIVVIRRFSRRAAPATVPAAAPAGGVVEDRRLADALDDELDRLD